MNKKIILGVSLAVIVVLVLGVIYFNSSKGPEDIVSSVSGNVIYKSLTIDDFVEGVELTKYSNDLPWPLEDTSVDIVLNRPTAMEDDQDPYMAVRFIYDYNDNSFWFNPEDSFYSSLNDNPSYEKFDEFERGHKYFVYTSRDTVIRYDPGRCVKGMNTKTGEYDCLTLELLRQGISLDKGTNYFVWPVDDVLVEKISISNWSSVYFILDMNDSKFYFPERGVLGYLRNSSYYDQFNILKTGRKYLIFLTSEDVLKYNPKGNSRDTTQNGGDNWPEYPYKSWHADGNENSNFFSIGYSEYNGERYEFIPVAKHIANNVSYFSYGNNAYNVVGKIWPYSSSSIPSSDLVFYIVKGNLTEEHPEFSLPLPLFNIYSTVDQFYVISGNNGATQAAYGYARNQGFLIAYPGPGENFGYSGTPFVAPLEDGRYGFVMSASTAPYEIVNGTKIILDERQAISQHLFLKSIFEYGIIPHEILNSSYYYYNVSGENHKGSVVQKEARMLPYDKVIYNWTDYLY